MIKKFINIYPGVLACACVAFLSLLMQRSDLFSIILPLSPLIIAITIGFAVKNTVHLPPILYTGIKFSAKKILRLAIIFMGFKLSFAEISGVGADALITISISSVCTLLFTVWLGIRMGIPRKRSILLGSGVSICGASAVAAVDGVIQSKEEDAAFAIGAITLLGTAFMCIYPVIYRISGMSDTVYALWSGVSIHEVAQVSAAASVMNNGVSEALASSVKMIRVLFIIPFTFLLLFIPIEKTHGKESDNKPVKKRRISVPWFAVLFFVSVVVNSCNVVPLKITRGIVSADSLLMTAAMAGLGMDISLRSILKIGKKAFVLGIISSLIISVLSGVVILILRNV